MSAISPECNIRKSSRIWRKSENKPTQIRVGIAKITEDVSTAANKSRVAAQRLESPAGHGFDPGQAEGDEVAHHGLGARADATQHGGGLVKRLQAACAILNVRHDLSLRRFPTLSDLLRRLGTAAITRPKRNADLNLLVELAKNGYQAVEGETIKLCVSDTGEFRMSHARKLCRFAGGKLALVERPNDPCRQNCPRLFQIRIGIAKITEYVSAAANKSKVGAHAKPSARSA
jgi:hypothetical protein